MTISRFAAPALLVLSVPAAPARAAEYVRNGDFSNSSVGWRLTLTANGLANDQLDSFDVTGRGTQTAIQLRVGKLIEVGDPAGGGYSQSVTIGQAGRYRFSADVAAFQSTGGTNADGGLFALLINNAEVTSYAAGEMAPPFGQLSLTKRSSLSYEVELAAGTYLLGIQARRAFRPSDDTFQYFTNVSFADVVPAAVPEPATWAAMVLGFGAAGGAMRQRRVRLAAA